MNSCLLVSLSHGTLMSPLNSDHAHAGPILIHRCLMAGKDEAALQHFSYCIAHE